eukprot:CAMPEP_0181302782 /NCGR_PEP_ID=MMETSP1101-20121128/8187_1 /TAXON_ID=46948 /ORGANISM="Rhodomonas abbreviata, Strain Caron Lab Isolate" /LENGTH=427 /DNA_ID=CAMNT_0023408269 /DNA_START=78 /DNA_END=1361 /DNA_ORIENTATION=+
MAPPIQLHQLPGDILVDIFYRVKEPAALVRLGSLSCKNVATVARSDAVWQSTFRSIWGSSLLSKVVASIPAEKDDGGEKKEAGAIPNWMLEPICLSSEAENELQKGRQLWENRPCLMTAFQVLAKLVPPEFNTNRDRCLTRLTEGEEDPVKKAKVVASFIHYFSPDRQHVASVRKAGVECMTVKSVEDPFSLSIRREYVRLFNLKGLSLPDAMRALLSYSAMPGEASRICRLLWVFAAEFHCQHGGVENTDRLDPKKATPEDPQEPSPDGGAWVNQDVVYLLMWSLLVLNADLQNPGVKNKMQLHDWVKNTTLALQGTGFTPSGVDSNGVVDIPSTTWDQRWGAAWARQHPAAGEAVAGSAVTAETLREMYGSVQQHPLLPHPSREPRVAKGLQRLTDAAGQHGMLSHAVSGFTNRVWDYLWRSAQH